MKWFHIMISTIREVFEASGRARVLSTLRQMDSEFLRRHGYAPEKIALGVDAWPWRTDAAVIPVSAASASAAQPVAAALAAVAPAELEHAA